MLRLLKTATTSCILLPIHLALAAPAFAQAAGGGDEPVVLVGVVRDASSNPIRGAVVAIGALGRSTRTNDAGAYRLELPTAEAAGRELELSVTLEAVADTVVRFLAEPGTIRRDVILDVPAVRLGALVATADRRARPARIGRVDAVRVMASAPVSTLSELLQARVPGVSVTRASGAAGAGSRIRTRGFGPLRHRAGYALYIDGVRAEAGPRESMLTGGPAMSALDDLAPRDIEAVEVLRGPAAAARYGPDGAAGVIVVRTRRGGMGMHRFSQRLTAGYGRAEVGVRPPDNWAVCTDPSVPVCAGLPAGTAVSDNPLLGKRGYRHGDALSLHWSGFGGGTNYGYSLALGLDREDGIVPGNTVDRRSGRVGVQFVPTERLRVDAGIGRSTVGAIPVLEGTSVGFVENGLMGSPLTVGGEEDGWQTSWAALREIESRVEIERTTPTLRLDHRTLPWLDQRLTLGADLVRRSERQRFPFVDAEVALRGQVIDAHGETNVYTIDYRATARLDRDPADAFAGRFSLGVQHLRESASRGYAERIPEDPPAPEQLTDAQREYSWQTTGVLGEWQLGYRDRLFVQAGARVDWMRLAYRDTTYIMAGTRFLLTASAFAEGEPDPVVAPFAGFSYLLSEASFWEPLARVVGTLRLHGAWGGTKWKHPAVDFADADGADSDMRGWIAGARPETVSELELGVEAGLLDDRLAIGVAYFRKTTGDISVEVPGSPVDGFGAERLDYAEVLHRGVELDFTARLLRGSNVAWDVSSGIRWLDNEVVRIGDDASLATGPDGLPLRVGHPVGAYFERPIIEVDTIENVARVAGFSYVGSPIPAVEAAVSTNLTIARRIRLYGRVDARGGYELANRTAYRRDWLRVSERSVLRDELPAVERLTYFGPYDLNGAGTSTDAPYVQDGSFVRLREASVTFELPVTWAGRLGASAASLTIGGRNLALWTDYEGGDPEVLRDPTSLVGRGDWFTAPQARRWDARLTVHF